MHEVGKRSGFVDQAQEAVRGLKFELAPLALVNVAKVDADAG